MGKGLNKLGEFNYIYKSFNVSARQARLLRVYLLSNTISIFSDDRISCTWDKNN